MTQQGYYATGLLSEMSALKARVAALEKALLASRGAGRLGAMLSGMRGDTPEVALPTADEIQPLYILDENGRDIYRLLAEVVNGKTRLYLQRVGRVRAEGE